MSRRAQVDPTRSIHPTNRSLIPPYGPEVPGCTPHLKPSIYCSWCGNETLDSKGVKVCPLCDTAPPFPTYSA